MAFEIIKLLYLLPKRSRRFKVTVSSRSPENFERSQSGYLLDENEKEQHRIKRSAICLSNSQLDF